MSNKGGLKFKIKENIKRKSEDIGENPPTNVKTFIQPLEAVLEDIPVKARKRIPALEIPPLIAPPLENLPDEEKIITLFGTTISQSNTYVSKQYSQHPEAGSMVSNFYSQSMNEINSKHKEFYKHKKSRLEEIEQETTTAKKIFLKNNQEWNEECNKLIDGIKQVKIQKMVEEIKVIDNKVLEGVRERTGKLEEYSEVVEGNEELVQKIREKQKKKIKDLFQKAKEVFNEVKENKKLEATNALNEFSYLLPVINSDPVTILKALSMN